MRIYICDNCGHRSEEKRGIVGRESEYDGFRTLAPAHRWANVVDVCRQCFRKITEARQSAREEAKEAERQSFLDKIATSD